MRSSRETKILNGICLILILAAGFSRLSRNYQNIFSYNGLICTLFTAALFIWNFQLRRRLVQSDVRRNLTATAYMMIFWIVIRTVKYVLLPEEHIAARYVWYLYYVPMVFIALFMFLSVLYIGRPYDRPLSRRWYMLFIPAVIIVGGILTNDLHQLAFYFPMGVAGWAEMDYIRGPFYYASMIWLAVLFVAMLVIVFVRCAVPANRKRIWIPILPLVIGVCYMILILLDQKSLLTDMFRVPEICCIVFAAFMESLILAHFFPSNDSYGDFWNASSIGAGIMGLDDRIIYESKNSIPVTSDEIREAEKKEVLLGDGNISLRSHRIHGGFGYWIKDISEVNHLNQELAALGNVLVEENAMLTAENEIKEKRIRIEQQNALYDSIAKSVHSQLDKISELLENAAKDEAVFEQTMKYACVLNSYVKRYSNLLLLLHQQEQIDSSELCLAISESLEYVRLYGVKAHGMYSGEGKLPGEIILLVYELFETALESAIPGADAVLVNLHLSKDELDFQMELNTPGTYLTDDFMGDKMKRFYGKLDMKVESGTEYISLRLPSGGESL